MKKLNLLTSILSLNIYFLLILNLSGCTPLVVGSAAVAGAKMIADRRSTENVFNDQRIDLIALHTFKQDPFIQGHAKLTATSYNCIVLLTGQAESITVARHASESISQIPKVTRVINEIVIGPTVSLAQDSEDLYITSRAKLALTEVKLSDFYPWRVKIVTEDGVVYLLGLVTPQEAKAAAEKIRYVPYVKRVVTFFEYLPLKS